MRRIISFMHISLDGFVAGPKGEMDWIKVDEELFDYVGKRISEGDMAMYGRVTFEMMESYWPTAGDEPNASKHDIEHSMWYSKVHKVVLSRTMEGVDVNNTSIISNNLEDRINEIKQQDGPDILLFGSPTATHTLTNCTRSRHSIVRRHQKRNKTKAIDYTRIHLRGNRTELPG
jgi:dihydrofolate reductase